MTLKELNAVVVSRQELELAMKGKFVHAVGALRVRTGLSLHNAVIALKLKLADLYLKQLWDDRHS